MHTLKQEHTVACKELVSGTVKHVRVLHVSCGLICIDTKHVSFMSYTQNAYMHAAVTQLV